MTCTVNLKRVKPLIRILYWNSLVTFGNDCLEGTCVNFLPFLFRIQVKLMIFWIIWSKPNFADVLSEVVLILSRNKRCPELIFLGRKSRPSDNKKTQASTSLQFRLTVYLLTCWPFSRGEKRLIIFFSSDDVTEWEPIASRIPIRDSTRRINA